MKIYPHYSSAVFVNTYLVGNEATGEALIIDPGKITPQVIHHIEHNAYKLTAVCITHSHKTHHAYGLKTLLKIYAPQVYAADSSLVNKTGKMLRGDCTLSIAGFTVECFSIPGHSPDSYIFKIENCIFTGDSISAGLIGKTLHNSASKSLIEHLRKKLLVYDDACILFPGHGPPTTIGTERQFTINLF